MMGSLVVIAAIVPLAWGCAALIAGHYFIVLPMFHHWQWWITLQAGPVLLLGLSLFAWMRAYRWRRMAEIRASMMADPTNSLVRGNSWQEQASYGRSSLERWSMLLALLALAAMPYWLHLPQPEWVAGAGLVILWLTRALLR